MNKYIELTKENEATLSKELTTGNVHLVPIVGKNGSGKTKLLKAIIKEAKKENIVIVIKAEFDQRKIMEQFDQYINELLVNEGKEFFINKYQGKLPKNDENFHPWFINYLSYDKQLNKINVNHDVKKSKIPSGIFLYSLLISLSGIIKTIKDKKGINKFLIIDEIEKYTHKTLAIKIANVITDLLRNDINVIFSTHSSIVLREIWHQYSELSQTASAFTESKLKFEILFMKSYGKKDNYKIYFKLLKKEQLVPVLQDCSYREQSIIFDTFFSENNILVEGLRDRELIDAILKRYYSNKYCDVHDCSGKGSIIRLNRKIMTLDVNDVFIMFDRDSVKSHNDINYNNYYFSFPKDLETSLGINKLDKSNTIMFNKKNVSLFKDNTDFKNLLSVLLKYLNR